MNNDADQFNEAWNEANAADAAPLGSGLARKAADAITGRDYQLHVQEAKAMGETPQTPEEFAKGRAK